MNYDGKCFIYTNGVSKFIVHPNYEIKISRGKVKVVNFITATKIKDPAEFTLPKYIKIETDWDTCISVGYNVNETKRQGRIAHHLYKKSL